MLGFRKDTAPPAGSVVDHEPVVEIREVVRIERDESDIRNERILQSMDVSQGVIEFTPDGTILSANQNFLSVVDYTLSDIVGQHHRMFMFPEDAASDDYRQFWAELAAGHFQSREFRRRGRGDREVWIQASYNPVKDDDGKVQFVIKFASDITKQKMAEKEILDRSQATIEFLPDGTIITANELFLGAVGYALPQIQGQHHRMFMPEGEANSPAYSTFWKELGNGHFKQGQFHRVDAHGNDLYLQGAYSPVFDGSGKVVKVTKQVSDVTNEIRTKQEASEVGETIAERVTEMSAAISEISRSIASTSTLASSAEANAGRAAAKVNDLHAKGEKIDEVVDVIHDLSDSTNLLALNATMEAARAGEKGRGFAVVASEVKKLATQTAEATEEIRSNVSTIQADMVEAVEMINEILEGAGEVSSETSMVAAAVEQQAALMSEMSDTASRLLDLNRH